MTSEQQTNEEQLIITINPDNQAAPYLHKHENKLKTIVINPRVLKTIGTIHKIKQAGQKTLKELIVQGLVVQIYYVFHDIRHGYGLYNKPQDIRARENLRLLLCNNIPKHLVIVGLVGRIPIPGTIEVLRSVLYNSPKARKYRNLQFQQRADLPHDIVIGKIKRYGNQLVIILNAIG